MSVHLSPTMQSEKSVSVQVLTSHMLSAVVLASTGAVLLLLLVNDRSDGLRILFTAVTGLQFLVLLWMLLLSLSILYDSDAWNDDHLDFMTVLDFYVMYILVWTNTGVLFWLWSGEEEVRGSVSFTNLEDLQPFSAWLVFFYITVFIMSGVGYGRYVAFSLLAEAWAAALAATSVVMLGMLLSSVVIRILDRTHLKRTALEVSGVRSKSS